MWVILFHNVFLTAVFHDAGWWKFWTSQRREKPPSGQHQCCAVCQGFFDYCCCFKITFFWNILLFTLPFLSSTTHSKASVQICHAIFYITLPVIIACKLWLEYYNRLCKVLKLFILWTINIGTRSVSFLVGCSLAVNRRCQAWDGSRTQRFRGCCEYQWSGLLYSGRGILHETHSYC